MPTDKPKIVIYAEEEIIKKIDNIAKKNNRSRANMCKTIITSYLEQYEQKNGTINVGEINQTGDNNSVHF